jgi:hypothetical protein
MRVIDSGVVPSLLSAFAKGAIRMASSKAIERTLGTDLFRMDYDVGREGNTLPNGGN